MQKHHKHQLFQRKEKLFIDTSTVWLFIHGFILKTTSTLWYNYRPIVSHLIHITHHKKCAKNAFAVHILANSVHFLATTKPFFSKVFLR